MTVTIRRAVLADAEHIGPVHAQVWRETYRGILSDAVIASISEDERVARWHTILRRPAPAQQWVAEVDGHIVGFAACGLPRETDPVRSLELSSIYLLQTHSRKGIGAALVAAALDGGPASVWVVEANYPAQRFYAALGFAPDGAHGEITEWESAPEIRMIR